MRFFNRRPGAGRGPCGSSVPRRPKGSGLRRSDARWLLPFLAAAPLLIGATPAKQVNWTATVTQGTNGAFIMGNPKAKVRLVEYVSYTCSHCAHFVGESKVPLKRDYVAKGLVSVELRNAVLNQYDLAAALSARCGGSGRFFGNTESDSLHLGGS